MPCGTVSRKVSMSDADKKNLNPRSRILTAGDKRAPNRAMLRAVGFSDADFDKPIIGVANGQSNITPCNAGLGKLADIASSEISRGGGMPQMFGTITISDGISMGTEGMKCSLIKKISMRAVVSSRQATSVRPTAPCCGRWGSATRILTNL